MSIGIFYFFDSRTGLFTGDRFTGPEVSIPTGNGAVSHLNAEHLPANFHWRKFRVDGQDVVPYKPPAPDDTSVFDEQEWLWVTLEERANRVRAQRAALLQQTDWMVTRAADQGVMLNPAWASYRQTLRDVPKQAGFPDSVVWPTPPGDQQ